MNTKNKFFVVIGTVAILGTSGALGASLFLKQDTQNSSAATSQAATSSSQTTAANTNSTSSASSYKDGTYTASQSYSVPHRNTNTVKISVTIASGKITAISANDEYADGESSYYIQSFEDSLQNAMVGKDIGSVSQSRIGAASLTSSAFYEALTTAESQAQA